MMNLSLATISSNENATLFWEKKPQLVDSILIFILCPLLTYAHTYVASFFQLRRKYFLKTDLNSELRVLHGENACFSVSALMKAQDMVFQEHIRSRSNVSIFIAKKSPWVVNMTYLNSIKQ